MEGLGTMLKPHHIRATKCPGRAALVVRAQARVAPKIANNTKRVDRPITLDNDRMYTDPNYLPSRQFGCVKAQPISGAGRGLVLTGDVHMGELILVSQPVGGCIRAAEGAPPSVQDVQMMLQRDGALSEDDKRRLMMLFNGRASSATQPLDLNNLIAPPAPKAKAAVKQKGFGAPKAEPSQAEPELTPELLQSIVRLNLYSQEYVDFGIAGLRGERSYAIAGVWPEHALLNHSCSPNTVTILVGDRLLVRAVLPMSKSTYITTNYIGLEAGAPVSHRRRALQEQYDFVCNCTRCKVESSQPEAVTSRLETMWAWFQEHGNSVQQMALGPNPRYDELAARQQELEAQVQQLEQVMEEHSVDSKQRIGLRASVYFTYELLSMLRFAAFAQQPASAPDPTLWSALVPLVNVFAPASDSHLRLAVDALYLLGGQAGESGKDGQPKDKATEEAGILTMQLHIARYGKVSDAVFTRLMQEREKVPSLFGRVNLPSPLSGVPRVA